MISKKQFDLMAYYAQAEAIPSQREIAGDLNLSLGTVNKTIGELRALGYASPQGLTPQGAALLERFRVKRAVIIAAGFGSRMLPITLNTPKPLVRVHGRRIVDTLLDALLAVGIQEIYLVRGYLAEQFDQLKPKYPTLRFIDNPLYRETNNISSALYACQHMADAYVMDGDLLLRDPSLITKYQYRSNYLGVPVEVTDDWCLQAKDGIITGIALGGKRCHLWVGLSYWTQEDGEKLARDIPQVYGSPGGKERYWDQTPLEYCKKNYTVAIRECSGEQIVEIDSFSDLKAIDKAYDV